MPETDTELDAYCHAVLRKLDFIMERPLDPYTASSIEQALIACKPKEHPVDVRGILPLHFSKLYYVVLMGRDARETSTSVDKDFRAKHGPMATAIYWFFALWPFWLIGYFAYYLLGNLPNLYRG